MVHIGIKIKEAVKQRGFTVSEFSRRINTSRENIYGIFKRKTIDTGLLLKISKILDYNFFLLYTGGSTLETDYNNVDEPNYKYNKSGKVEIKNQNNVFKTDILTVENTALRKENEYLKEINSLLKEKLEKGK